MIEHDKGPIEILCKEIGFQFEIGLERHDLLVRFVAVLVGQVASMHGFRKLISARLGEPSLVDKDDVETAIFRVQEMLSSDDPLSFCSDLHDYLNQPEDGPCNHYLDMLSSCVSAIRFGLESPCHSRHAAHAAQHIWKHRYGVSLFDQCTSAWENDWTRQQLQAAIISLMLPKTQPDGPRQDTSGQSPIREDKVNE